MKAIGAEVRKLNEEVVELFFFCVHISGIQNKVQLAGLLVGGSGCVGTYQFWVNPFMNSLTFISRRYTEGRLKVEQLACRT